MFQYFFNTSDEDVEKYLNLFTFYKPEKIKEIMITHREQPEKRLAQNILAETILKILYFSDSKKNGEKEESQLISKNFFKTDFKTFVKKYTLYSYCKIN